MTPEELEREERLCIIMEGCKVSYEEAIVIINQEQGQLFNQERK